jgi:hypothetical protein
VWDRPEIVDLSAGGGELQPPATTERPLSVAKFGELFIAVSNL